MGFRMTSTVHVWRRKTQGSESQTYPGFCFLPSGSVQGGRKWRLNLRINFFFFWLCCVAHGILILQPEIEPIPPALKTQSLNHWTARVKSPKNLFLSSNLKIQMLTSGIYSLFLKRVFPENHLSIYNNFSGVLYHLSTAPPSHRQDHGRQQPRENHCNQE